MNSKNSEKLGRAELKVKKFRIRPRLPSVGRILKSILNARQLPDGLEETLPGESEAFLKNIMPTAFYHTWSREDVPEAFGEILEQAGCKKAVAVSALIATIGPDAEDYLSKLLMNGESQRSQVVTALSEESADLSLQFLFRLLQDDAEGDDCEITGPLPVGNDALLSEILTLMEAAEEGVTKDSAGHLAPRFTRVALAAWTPVAKRKKAAAAPKKRLG